MNLKNVIKFVDLLNDFRKVERDLYATGIDRKDNDVEHSYQLAMLSWYIADSFKLDLDKDLVIKYALVHDFVEVYAGDVPVFGATEAQRADKSKKEKEAAELLSKNFSEFPEFHHLIEKYEERSDKESRFVHALDKLHPALDIYRDKGKTWKKKGINLKMVIEEKIKKVDGDKVVQKLFEEFVEVLKREESGLF